MSTQQNEPRMPRPRSIQGARLAGQVLAEGLADYTLQVRPDLAPITPQLLAGIQRKGQECGERMFRARDPWTMLAFVSQWRRAHGMTA